MVESSAKSSSDDVPCPGVCLTGWPWSTPPVIEASSVIFENYFAARFFDQPEHCVPPFLPVATYNMTCFRHCRGCEDWVTPPSCGIRTHMQTMLHPPLLPMLSTSTGFLEIVCSIVRSRHCQRLGRTTFISFQRIVYNQALPL